jgi:hypothetical protein
MRALVSRSPKAENDGRVEQRVLFGHNFTHNVTINTLPESVDDVGLISTLTVRQYREVSYLAGGIAYPDTADTISGGTANVPGSCCNGPVTRIMTITTSQASILREGLC